MKELQGYISGNEKLSIRRQCELLAINRSSFYYKAVGETKENLEIMTLIDKRHLDKPTHGILQMQDYLLLTLGLVVNYKRVKRLLRKMRIMAIYPMRNLSRLGKAKYIRPYLLKYLAITGPNQVWAIDITYIPMKLGFMYLTAIIDVYSRYIVGWDIFNTLDADNSLTVLIDAIAKNGKPGIINSDQGSQFTCALWTEYLDKEAIKISMDGKGRALDNIFIERFWRTCKRDYVYLYPSSNGYELFEGLSGFMYEYNHEKRHQGIGRCIPFDLFFPAA
ncbi:MAG: IS3 family transposase [Candidatus Riflemargulisbacteria bacterium]